MASIRLTKEMRNSIVRDIMNDVPSTHYYAQAEKVLRDAFNKVIPAEVLALAEDHSERLCRRSVPFFLCGESITLCVFGATDFDKDRIDQAEVEKAGNLMKLYKDQKNTRNQLRRKLEATLSAFTTVEQVRKALPEFEKYLPTAVQPVKNLPAVTNTVADLMQAGWPKNKEAAPCN